MLLLLSWSSQCWLRLMGMMLAGEMELQMSDFGSTVAQMEAVTGMPMD
jgi:hypothetical protein